MDKVNNWFQNRRAKTKQDAKKAAGQNLLLQQQAANNQANYSSSDSETSPAFSSPEYLNMMQQCTTETRLPNGLGLSQIQHVQEQHNYQNMHFIDTSAGAEPYNNFATHQMPPDMFDSPQEMQRRTLTQEQFDAFAQCAAMNGANYDLLQTGFSGDQAVMNQVFPELQHPDIKQQQSFVYQGEVPPSVSSYDSSIPSTTAEPPMPPFPSSNSIQDRTNFSSSSSDWTNSRSSSVAGSYHEEPFAQMSTPQQPPSVTTSQWQPGQSVPVDFNALNEEFRQAAASARQHPQHPQSHEQPLAFPADEAFVRRDSHTSTMLAQSMSNVGIHTPQPVQQGTFKSPAPPTSIAARRQRPGPLNLGRAALRSQSYSGAAQPASPGQMQPTSAAGGVHPLRRIRSTNIVNGVAQGRVQKSLPGSAQRSPLNWTFADSINSPISLRNTSNQASGNLAPPTPMSPSEFSRADQPRPIPSWHSSSHISRQPSISESELEHGGSIPPSISVPPPNFSSPPHTPLYHQQSVMQTRVGHNVITENTPPQSAPASQQCFPVNSFSISETQMPPPPQQTQAPIQQPMPEPAQLHQQQFTNVFVSDQQFQTSSTTPSSTPYIIPTSGITMNYSQSVPLVDSNGDTMQYVPMSQAQMMPQIPAQHVVAQQPVQHVPYAMFNPGSTIAGIQTTSQLLKHQPPQPATEFFVHEYNPPQDVKLATTPRKHPVETGPKNYIFANQTPEHFAEKGKKGTETKAGTASNSPASSIGAASS